MSDLTFICGNCRKPILGDTGSVSVTYAALHAYQREAKAWQDQHGGRAVDLAELLAHPDDVRWEPLHDSCKTDAESGRYEIDAAKLGTWRELVRWTAHLMEKNWLGETDWDVLLREAADGSGDGRIRREAS